MPTVFSKETYLYWYELMQLIRQFETTAEEKYKMEGKIRGFFHAYVGQEAIAAGFPDALVTFVAKRSKNTADFFFAFFLDFISE